jgi:phosphoribosylformimino-5-aminoimidazole carboxamide ribotide isomerase
VQLVGGDFGAERVRLDDPVAVAKRFEADGALRLHVIDLDAAKGVGENRSVIKRIIEAVGIPVEVGGGVRSVDTARELLSLGARWVIVGTAAVKDASFLPALCAAVGKERIILALDYKAGRVVVNGWDASVAEDPITLGKRLEQYCGGILLTCVDVEGQMKGADCTTLSQARASLKVPVIASGGVGCQADLLALERTKVDAVVIGMALYTGRISLSMMKTSHTDL